MAENSGPSFTAERSVMVARQLRDRGISDERVLAAMDKIPRHEFVSPQEQSGAYADRPVPIGEQQTTSQPYIIAAMLQAAEIQPADKVLEVGSGSGYQTALLAELAREVFAVERHPALVAAASAVLLRLGYNNVTLRASDGTLGWPEAAPFDAIIVSAAAPRVPPALLEQLAIGGRLVIPVGHLESQDLQLVRKTADGIDVKVLEGCRFVPLIGEQGFKV